MVTAAPSRPWLACPNQFWWNRTIPPRSSTARKRTLAQKGVFTIPGEPGFSAVVLHDDRLQWVTCLECDTGCEVVRRAGRFRLHCHSCCEGS